MLMPKYPFLFDAIKIDGLPLYDIYSICELSDYADDLRKYPAENRLIISETITNH